MFVVFFSFSLIGYVQHLLKYTCKNLSNVLFFAIEALLICI